MKTRLQRFLADCGIASRRECEAMILSGRVRVNGRAPTTMPVLIDPANDIVTVDDEQVAAGQPAGALSEQRKVYFLLNKPKGILVTSKDPSDRKTVGELMTGVKERTFPVGRLDMDARGALIMTNDGELANRLTHPRYGIEKVYIVEVDGRLGHEDLEKIKRGVWLGPGFRGMGQRGTSVSPRQPASPPAPAKQGHDAHATAKRGFKTEGFRARLIGRERGRTILELKLTGGGNTEIRRVMARLGHNVRDLNRVAIAEKITTRGLEPGQFRPLSDSEVKWLYRASSPEFHSRERAATQAWYEQKEMEKERKRLARETEQPGAPRPTKSKVEDKESKFRPRPPRKGRKPFIPPTGRNAGKPLGGSFLGRKRLAGGEMSGSQDAAPMHPLGDSASHDD